MIILNLPKIFWDDHAERCGSHPGIRNELKRGYRTVMVALDEEALDDLRSDARFYGTCEWSSDEVNLSIPRSAKSTMNALRRQGIAK